MLGNHAGDILRDITKWMPRLTVRFKVTVTLPSGKKPLSLIYSQHDKSHRHVYLRKQWKALQGVPQSKNAVLLWHREEAQKNELHHEKTNKMTCAPSQDSDQPGHPLSLIRVFAVRNKKPCVPSIPLSAQRRFWSDCADMQADPSLRWAHRSFCSFCRAAAQIWNHKNVDIQVDGQQSDWFPLFQIRWSQF